MHGPEGEFWKRVRKAWRGHAVRVEASLGGVDPGTPDVCLGYGGRNGWIELKVWPDPLNPQQIAWHAEALEKGSYAMVLCSLGKYVWLGRFDHYNAHFKYDLVGDRVEVDSIPRAMHLHVVLGVIESALSRR